jgi:hypothetical protein
MKKLLKRYALYLFRWQLSTPILAVVLILLASLHPIIATVIANFIGGLIFFWVDRYIFAQRKRVPQWEIAEEAKCSDCGITERGYRVTEWLNYNRVEDQAPQFRCGSCAQAKLLEIYKKHAEIKKKYAD